MTFAQADPSAGDGGDWVAHGLTEYDNKGAARRAYRAWFYTGDPATFPLSTIPPAKYGRQRNDAFGRALETFNLDGTVTLASVYHALSTDAWDGADLSPGPHYGTYATRRQDGHGRVVSMLERIHAGSTLEARETTTTYLPTDEVAMITRSRGSDSVVRWIRYDSLGRMVLNVEPNTTADFNRDPTTAASAMKAWRYAYDDAGDLVGTSDARGCGSNYLYDTAGRLLGEDYSPCLAAHSTYSSPNLSARTGVEVLYHYDDADADAVSSPASDCASSLLKGRLASVADRASHTLTCFDGRGRLVKIAKRIAKPGIADDAIADRYGAQWWMQTASYDAADRPVRESTGADVSALMGGDGKSEVVTSYSNRGSVKSVTGSYGTLMDHVTHDADGLPLEYQYGDLAGTKTTFEYDDRKRLLNVMTYRGPPSAWTGGVPTYSPGPTYGSGTPTTFQTLIEDSDFFYDAVDNPVEIRDYRMPDEWPAGAKPVTRKMVYDDLYRLTRIDYQYKAGADAWTSPFQPENDGTSTDPKRALPSPQVSFANRILWQTFAYDWLGNTTQTADDAQGFYDRSLGAISNGTATAGPYQLTAAANDGGGGTPAPRSGHLTAAYDPAGNLVSMAVQRRGDCLPTGANCGQRFVYEWDEVGRLVRARRWDASDPGTARSSVPATTAAAELRYAYDGKDQRVLKTAVDASGDERSTVYVLSTLELRRAEWDAVTESYSSTSATQVPYLFASDVRLGRVAYEPASAPSLDGGRLHVLLALADHLGSVSAEIDQATSELVERTTFQAYGGIESDYRPSRWKGEREDYRFTGKEDDIEVGLSYFGARYYAPALGRWISADPAAIHIKQADDNAYAYVHGKVLAASDPMGLDLVTFIIDWSSKGLATATANQWNKSVAREEVKQTQAAIAEQYDASRLKRAVDDPEHWALPTLVETAKEAFESMSPGGGEGDSGKHTVCGAGCGCSTAPKVPDGKKNESAESTASANAPSPGKTANDQPPSTGAKQPRFEGKKPTYHVNEAHDPNAGPKLSPKKEPLPKDAEEVFKNAVPGSEKDPTAWYGKNKDGVVYRFSDANDGTAHFSGSSAPEKQGIKPIKPTPYAAERLEGK